MQNKISIIYQDKNFLALSKPAGLLTHSVKSRIKNSELGIKEQTLVDWILKNYPEVNNVGDLPVGRQVSQTRPGIVHRLDKDTSGVILIARNQKYFEYLKKLFQTSQIKKTYLALVWGKVEPKTGIIKKPIYLKKGTTKRTVWQGKMEKPAITEYKVLKYYQYKSTTFSFLKVLPKTGRTHQIRVHLASIGHPIVGDSLYGPKKLVLKRQFLHAQSLEFSSAEGKRIKIEAELPEELKITLKSLTISH